MWATLTGPGIDTSNDLVMSSDTVSNRTIVARTGSIAPGGPPGAVFGQLYSAFQINDQEIALFRGQMSGGGVTTNNSGGLWAGLPQNISLIARQGDQAAGLPNGVNYGDFFNDVANTRLGWGNNGGALVSPLTGTGVTTSNDKALWLITGSSLNLAVRKGDQVPGEAQGVVFDDFINNIALNNNGYVAFQGHLAGPGVTNLNNSGIWIATPTGLIRVVRSGDVIDLGPGQGLQTVTGAAFDFYGFGNDSEFAWTAGFSNGSEAILITSIPEPGVFAFGACVMGIIFIIWRRGLFEKRQFENQIEELSVTD
jgi:hypothetical protein